MSAHLEELAARKSLLLSRIRLERMQVALNAGGVRESMRVASLVGSAIAKPAAAAMIFGTIAPLFGLRRLAFWVRIASVGFAVFRVAREWRKAER